MEDRADQQKTFYLPSEVARLVLGGSQWWGQLLATLTGLCRFRGAVLFTCPDVD